MLKSMFFSSTRIVRLPKVSGKACAQYLGSLWERSGNKSGLVHNHRSSHRSLWINQQLYPVLYTNCIQRYKQLVGNFTSVNPQFYTLYTAPITTTTTFIYKKRGTL